MAISSILEYSFIPSVPSRIPHEQQQPQSYKEETERVNEEIGRKDFAGIPCTVKEIEAMMKKDGGI